MSLGTERGGADNRASRNSRISPERICAPYKCHGVMRVANPHRKGPLRGLMFNPHTSLESSHEFFSIHSPCVSQNHEYFNCFESVCNDPIMCGSVPITRKSPTHETKTYACRVCASRFTVVWHASSRSTSYIWVRLVSTDEFRTSNSLQRRHLQNRGMSQCEHIPMIGRWPRVWFYSSECTSWCSYKRVSRMMEVTAVGGETVFKRFDRHRRGVDSERSIPAKRIYLWEPPHKRATFQRVPIKESGSHTSDTERLLLRF